MKKKKKRGMWSGGRKKDTNKAKNVDIKNKKKKDKE
jgi:hypothetical protein